MYKQIDEKSMPARNARMKLIRGDILPNNNTVNNKYPFRVLKKI